MTQANITHLIYDMDGVLLNTEIYYTEATQQIVQQYGKKLDWDTKARMIGRQAAVAAQVLIDSLQLPITADDYIQQRDQLLSHLFPKAEPMAGAQALTQRMHQCGILQAIATSSPTPAFNLKMQRHQAWLQIFNTIVRGDDPNIKACKPAPDLFLTAAANLNAEPKHCLVFEDSPAGIEAAKTAGMWVIALTDPHMNPEIYRDADEQITRFNAFQPAQWGLPS